MTFFTATYIEVVPPGAEQCVALLRAYRDVSRRGSDALQLDVLWQIERPNQFTVLAVWKDEEGYAAHTRDSHYARLNEGLAPHLAAPNDTRQHSGLTIGDGSGTEGTSITVVTHVDVVPPERDNCVAAITQLAAESRNHDGNLRFDVWQQMNRLNHFSVVEAWSSRSVFDAHGMAGQTRDFRAKLASMTGALYDERLFMALG